MVRLLFLLLAAFLGGSPALRAGELTVYAAASLSEALTAVADLYEKQSGAALVFNFAASSILVRQIEAGGRADIFLSADEEKMNQLERERLVQTRTNLLSNSLVIAVPTSNQQRDWPAALREAKRIALAEPGTVPAGIYARKYLENAGLWKNVRQKVIPTQNVRGSVAAVESGNVDAAIIYKTDVHLLKSSRVAYEIPVDATPPIIYPAAVISETQNPNLAADFLNFLSSPAAMEIFRRHGFRIFSPAPQD